jgi:hypothetical protein
MARINVNIALGLTLIGLAFVMGVPLHGAVGVVVSTVVSMAMLIAGVALLANRNTPWRELRPKFTKFPKWGTGR